MICKIFLIPFLFSSLIISSKAQVSEEWVARYHPTLIENDFGTDLQIDATGNVYVIGMLVASENQNQHWTILKYNPSGSLLWNIIYTGPYTGMHDVSSIALSNTSGCIYVAGFIQPPNAAARSVVTKKITFQGTEQWTKIYTFNDDQPYKISVSNSGNIFVAGRTGTSGLLIKYNQNGDSLWVKRYKFNNWENGGFIDIAVDPFENIYITSGSGAVFLNKDFITTKFNTSGQLLWERNYDGTAHNNDEPSAIDIDNSGNVYVAGKSRGIGTDYDFTFISYSADGDFRWEKRFSSPLDDEAMDLITDNANNIYVTGFLSASKGSGDMLTVKCKSSGNISWQRPFNYIFDLSELGKSITIDDEYNVYITGGSNRPSGVYEYSDYLTLKYDPNGSVKWVMNYNCLPSGINEDKPTKIAIDNNHNVYVTGWSYGVLRSDICTIKYSPLIGIIPVTNLIPGEFTLYQNYPNPFNPETKIRFDIAKSSYTTLKIYDAMGSEISTLVNENISAGTYEVTWNAQNFTSGVYFYKLINEDFTQTKKMVLIK